MSRGVRIFILATLWVFIVHNIIEIYHAFTPIVIDPDTIIRPNDIAHCEGDEFWNLERIYIPKTFEIDCPK